MKRNLIVFGGMAGLVISIFMVVTTAICYRSGEFNANMLVSYAVMLIAFSFIFVGIKNYRDKYNNGTVSFGKAFKLGISIALIASTMYVLIWLIDYYCFFPDFMEKYTTHVLKDAKANGVTGQELQEKTAQMASYREMYKNPIFVILLTYMEILPLGIVITLISALILKRKYPQSNFVVNTQL
jgi:ethanolamine transporter EutH